MGPVAAHPGGGEGVTPLQLGTDVARVSTAVGSSCGLEYEPLRVLLSSRLSSVSVLVSVSMPVSLNHDNDGDGQKEAPGWDAP